MKNQNHHPVLAIIQYAFGVIALNLVQETEHQVLAFIFFVIAAMAAEMKMFIERAVPTPRTAYLLKFALRGALAGAAAYVHLLEDHPAISAVILALAAVFHELEYRWPKRTK